MRIPPAIVSGGADTLPALMYRLRLALLIPINFATCSDERLVIQYVVLQIAPSVVKRFVHSKLIKEEFSRAAAGRGPQPARFSRAGVEAGAEPEAEQLTP